MFKRGDREHLEDMLIACQNIAEYLIGFDYDAFLSDRKTQDAVLRNIEILGEAVKNISKDIKTKYPEIGWRDIARTRDKLIHSYFGVDIDIVWDICFHDIPRLEKQLMEVLKKEKRNPLHEH